MRIDTRLSRTVSRQRYYRSRFQRVAADLDAGVWLSVFISDAYRDSRTRPAVEMDLAIDVVRIFGVADNLRRAAKPAVLSVHDSFSLKKLATNVTNQHKQIHCFVRVFSCLFVAN